MLPEAPSGLVPSEIRSEQLFERATARCVRGPEGSGEVLRRLRAGDPDMHSRFRYALAKELAEYLARLEAGFCGIYLYGSAMGEAASQYSDIDVIVVVESRHDETMRVLARLDLSLVTQYRCLVGTRTRPSSLLDARVIEEADIARRDGYGAIVDGLFTRPVCLWRSTPDGAGASR
jgi:predicted nucleotidyltransferase